MKTVRYSRQRGRRRQERFFARGLRKHAGAARPHGGERRGSHPSAGFPNQGMAPYTILRISETFFPRAEG